LHGPAHIGDHIKAVQVMAVGPSGCGIADGRGTLAHPELQEVHVILPATPRAAALARQATRRALKVWSLVHLQDDANLVVSELVSNAVRHGSGHRAEITLRMKATNNCLRIEVHDADPAMPVPRTPASLDESGRGFIVVEALTAKWGIQETEMGKAVWAELADNQALFS
jgi:anti-sigma regulatory factor (Ser/Thr protein kinase)